MALESSGKAAEGVQVFEFGQFRADLRARTLLCGSQPVPITSKVFDTLAVLLRNHGQVVEKDQLLKAIWPDAVVEESNLHHYVSTVRKALGEKSGENRFVATVPGRGYSFVGPVRLVTQEAPEVSRFARRRLVLGAALLAFVALLVVVSRSVAHRIPPDKPSIRHLTASLGVAEMASFSPDGKEVVFSWQVQGEDHSHLYTKAIGSETMLPITSGADSYSYPAWSPDGARIAFIRYSAAREVKEFCLMPARGGPVTVLAPARCQANNSTKIVWTKDGNHVIIESIDTSQPSRLNLLSVDGKQRRLLASAVEQSMDFAPAVSPDGKLLAFLRRVRVNYELRVMPTMGDESKVLLAEDRGVAGSGIAWTPDSRGIVYSTSAGLWKVPLSGGDPAPLGIGSDKASYPAISKRGDLAFTEPATQVTLIRATLPQPGQGPVVLRELFSSTQKVRYPQWSPDGKQIAFWSERSGTPEISLSDAEGGSQAQLTSFAGGGPPDNPRWSPDGKTIAFDAAPAGNSDIYLISASGGAPRRLTTEPSMDTHAAWSNDGETIYFSSDRSGTVQVWKMPVAGGRASQVTSDGGYFPAISADRHLYFLKSRMSTTVWRMPLDGGRAEFVLDGPRAPRLWTPTAEGVYYLDRTSLRYFEGRSGRHSEPLVQFQPSEISVASTIGASPDGRSLLIPRFRQSGTDVMLVERFW